MGIFYVYRRGCGTADKLPLCFSQVITTPHFRPGNLDKNDELPFLISTNDIFTHVQLCSCLLYDCLQGSVISLEGHHVRVPSTCTTKHHYTSCTHTNKEVIRRCLRSDSHAVCCSLPQACCSAPSTAAFATIPSAPWTTDSRTPRGTRRPWPHRSPRYAPRTPMPGPPTERAAP